MKNVRKQRFYKSGIALSLVLLIFCTPSISLGWGAAGHMMVAQIAYGRLNPKAKAKANELLAIEINPAAESRKSKDFVNASHWADDLRPFTEFDSFKPLHFIDNPFSIDDTPLPAGVPEPDNIVKALEDNLNILKTSTDKDAQAQALRLIIHFVGDIHQPLHCATRVDRNHPDGDRGGNLVSIKVPGTNGKLKTTNLHSFWDGGIGDFPTTGANFKPPALSKIPPAAAKAKAGNPANDPDLKLDDPFNFSAWANESFALAKDVAYDGMQSGAKPSVAYKSKALKVARKRVAWGGYRLAALLNAVWPN
ncbi:MAG: 3-nucleotidase/nuclease [Acidobacteria bacterium]|nr:3-nucleotidase/nuclease [Acidobacteriota bacterium]